MAPRSTVDGDGDMHYLGVRKRQFGRYSAEIRDPNKKQRICLGIFESDEAAARAYDNAARRYRGPNAITNFPPLDLNVQIKSLNELLFNNETSSGCSTNPIGSYPMQLSLFGRLFRTMPTAQTHMLRLRPESYQEIADKLNKIWDFPVDGISKGIDVDLNLPPPENL